MATFIEQVALDALHKLKKHSLSICRPLNDAASCTISQNSGLMTVAVTGLNLSTLAIFPGSICQIIGGPSNGFYIITEVFPGYVIIDGGTAQNYGQVIFFDCDFELIVDICSVARKQAETYTGQSFTGVLDFAEYRDGNNSTRLVLQKRRIRSVTRMTIYSLQPYIGLELTIQPSDLDMTFAQNTGILQITPEATGGSILMNSNVITAKYFPGQKIRIEGTYGWNEDETPDDVRKALVYIASANLLVEEMSRNGNPNSFTIEGYSESSDVGRDISSFMGIANSLLAGYVGDIVGS